jgi:hypothetical protein
MKINITNVG